MSPSRKKIMSDALKWELARELGVQAIVARDGWGSVSSRDCGNLVRLAIERAERQLAAAGNVSAAPLQRM